MSGPVSLTPPAHVQTLNVVSAEEMYTAVMREIKHADIFISVAAVADYRCRNVSSEKISKTQDTLTLELEKNHDIISAVANLPNHPFVVGFAAETEKLLDKAQAKLQNKKLDMIVANQIGDENQIGSDENTVTVLWGKNKKEFPRTLKTKLARELVKLIAENCK